MSEPDFLFENWKINEFAKRKNGKFSEKCFQEIVQCLLDFNLWLKRCLKVCGFEWVKQIFYLHNLASRNQFF